MAVRRRAIVRGRVQGVFFRDTTAERARASGVAGWVRNRDDGSVEAVFEGEDDAVAKLLEFAHEGSEQAAVEDVEVIEEGPEGLHGFRVL